MQGLADGYFVLPSTISDYLAPLLGEPAGRRPTTPRSGGRGRGRRPDATVAVDQRQRTRSTTSTASSATSCGTTAAWPAAEQSLEKALTDIPALREEFYADVQVLGERRDAQPVAREGRPRRRLPRVRRAALPRRARTARSRAAATSASSTRPRTARRCATTSNFSLRRRVGVHRRGQRTDAPQGAARVRVRPPRPAQLQVGGRASSHHGSQAPRLAPGGHRRTRLVRGDRRTRHQSRDVVPRDVRRRQRPAASPRATSRSPSTTTAARASAARAR